jgi:hypothetical protein
MRAELREAKAARARPSGSSSSRRPTCRRASPRSTSAATIWCVVDPDDLDPSSFEVAVRLARYLALAGLAARDAEIDTAAISQALASIREQLDQIRNLKSQLTSIGNATKAVWNGLDALRAGVVDQVARAEAGIRVGARD